MLFRLFFVCLCVAASATAAVLRLEVTERSDVLDGKSFGKAGPYERLSGSAYFAVDPKLPANRIIRDIDLAPRNEKGLVEFSSDFYVLKPRNPVSGNGAVLYEVSNRGRKGMLSFFNRASGSLDPRLPEHFGDGFLLEQGYTLLWLGWQFDVPRTEGLVRLSAPVAGQGITGLVRSEFIPDEKIYTQLLADRAHVPYEPAVPDDPAATLTVRPRRDAPRQVIPRNRWKLVEGTHASMEAGFEPGLIYEVVYRAKNPTLVGLGPTAIRDMVSFLKHGGALGTNFVLSDQRRFIKRAYGFGVSQSSRFLRTFLYFGFNADEQNRQVFDGVLAHVGGGGRGSFNHRFAQASRDGHPFFNLFYPTDIYPFADLPQSDPETGLNEGILSRAMADKVVPKVFYTNASYEYWGRAASLVHTTFDGKADAPLSDTTRVYLFAGGQHGPGAFPPARNRTQHLSNPNPFTWSMRALLVAMDQWVAEGKEPPPSQYPKVATGELVRPEALKFPAIPGVKVPQRIQEAYRVDYGPDFRTKGLVTKEPPAVGKPFVTLVPQVDADGNETTGIRMPGIQAPLATYTGWNLRAPEIGAPDEIFSMVGSFLPFARTKAQRGQDPRPSIAERYKDRADYAAKVEAAAKRLAADRYLLEADVTKVVQQTVAVWDHLHK
ncbi:MAG: hypothetical protein IPM24_13640 [Bryobacterales bacterium]|nr:hypothetical protein [Bryobacterales bacterium]